MQSDLRLRLLLTSGIAIAITFGIAILAHTATSRSIETANPPISPAPKADTSPKNNISISSLPLPQINSKLKELAMKPTQGIQGTVVQITGNQMPMVGQKKAVPQPISATVWVFYGRIKPPSDRWLVSEAQTSQNWITAVATDANGRFTIGLPAGEYTLLVQYEPEANGKSAYLYSNAYTKEGEYKSVVVEPTKVTEVSLTNTEKVTF